MKLARVIYLISIITGWFPVRYDSEKNRVKYWKFIYVLGRIQFYLIIFGAMYKINHEMYTKDIGSDFLAVSLTFFQELWHQRSFIGVYSRLKKFRFEIVKLINQGLRLYEISKAFLRFKINYFYIKLLTIKLLLMDIPLIILRINYVAKHTKNSSLMTIVVSTQSILFLNFLNLNNLHQIVMRSFLSCVAQQLQFTMKSIKINQHQLNQVMTIFNVALQHSFHFKRIFSSIFSRLYINCLFNFFVQVYLLMRIFISSLDKELSDSLLLWQCVASASLEISNLLLSSYLSEDVHNEV